MLVAMLASRIGVWFLNLLFPKNCAGCYKEGGWLCDNCFFDLNKKQQKIVKISKQIRRVYALFLFSDKTVANIIYRLKYSGIKDYGKIIARLILEKNKWLVRGDYLLVGVPIYRAKQRIKGYNHSAEIAVSLAMLSKNDYSEALVKNYPTKSQTKLTKKERLENVKNSFGIVDKRIVKDRKIIIIDDVLTTGATLNEVAKQIQKGKPKEILAITVAVD